MTTLKLELDSGVFSRLMQSKLSTVLVDLPYLPAPGAVVAVNIMQGKRIIETVECTIVFVEHSGLQAHLYNVSLVRGNHHGVPRIMDTPVGPVELQTQTHKLRVILAETLERIASTERESIRISLKRKADLLAKVRGIERY